VKVVGGEAGFPKVLRVVTLTELAFTLQGKCVLKRPRPLLLKEVIPSLESLAYQLQDQDLWLTGQLKLLCLYVGVDQGVHSREFNLRFARIFPRQDFDAYLPLELKSRLNVLNFGLESVAGQRNEAGIFAEIAVNVEVKGKEVVPAALCLPGGSGQERVLVEGERVIGAKTLRFMHEHRCKLFYVAKRVGELKTQVLQLQARPVKGQVLLEGVLWQEVFYVGADDVLHHQEEKIPFQYTAVLAGAAEGMNLQLKPRVTGVKYSIEGEHGDTIAEKIFLEVAIKVTGRGRVSVVVGTEQPVPALERELLYLQKIVAEGREQVVVESSINLKFPGRELGSVEATVEEIHCEILPGKVLLQGIMHEDIYIIGEEGIEYHQEQQLSFSAHLELAGVYPGMEIKAKGIVDNIYPCLHGNGLKLEQKILVTVAVTVMEGDFLPVVVAVKAPGWEADSELLEVELLVAEVSGKVLVETETNLVRYARKIGQIEAEVINVTWEVLEDKLLVAGEIRERIFYITRELVEYHQQYVHAFTHFFEVPGARLGMRVRVVEAVVEYLQHTLNPDGDLVNQQIMLKLRAQVSEGVQREVITDLKPLYLKEALFLLKEEKCTIMLEKWLELSRPFPKQIIECKAHLQDVQYKCQQNQVEVSGTIVQELYYVGINNRLLYYREDIPFAQGLDLGMADPEVILEGDAKLCCKGKEQMLLPGGKLENRIKLEYCLQCTLRFMGQYNVIPG
jgi:hypothetical protein